MRKRKPAGKCKTTCSKCGGALEENRVGKYRYCKSCHNEYMRDNRKNFTVSDEQKKKMLTRSYTQNNIQRGRILKDVCYLCGDPNVQAHHNDYDKPLEVVWLCDTCHKKAHSDKKIMDLVKKAPPAKLRPKKNRSKNCSKCKKPKEPDRLDQRYCNSCHAEYMRAYRKNKKTKNENV